MGNPFKKDFIEARINAKISPEKLQAMMDAKARIYTARFIHAGVCGYREQNDITYLSSDVLYKMAESYLGRPVVVGHDLNITAENIEEKMKGTVVHCYTNDGDEWFVDFTVTDPKVVKKIDEEGFNYVSCAYIITEQAEEPEVHDGLECTTVVLDGFYHHLAITNSPRYDNTEIWRMNEDENIDLKKVGFSGIVSIESKENSNKEKTMFAFLKKEVPVDENLMFDTDAGRLNTSDLIAKINELVKENEELKNKCDCSKKNADYDKDEDKKDKDEEKENCSGKDNCSGKKNEDDEEKDDKDDKENCSKKNVDDEEKDKKDDDKDSKENEESHEPSKTIPEAQAKANEEAMKSDALKDAMPKVNEDPKVATVKVRGLSKLK